MALFIVNMLKPKSMAIVTPQTQEVQVRAPSALETLFYLYVHSFKCIFRDAFQGNFFIFGSGLLVSFHHTKKRLSR